MKQKTGHVDGKGKKPQTSKRSEVNLLLRPQIIIPGVHVTISLPRLSSHPEHFVPRRIIYIIVSVLPLACFIVYVFARLLWGLLDLNFHDAKAWGDLLGGLINELHSVAAWLAGTSVLAVGFGVCGLLIVLASRFPIFGKRDALRTCSGGVWWLVLGLTALIGIIGVLFTRFTNGQYDFMGQVLLLGPIMLAIFVAGPLLDFMYSGGSRGKPFMKWLCLFFLTMYLASLFGVFTSFMTDSLASLVPDAQWDQLKKSAIADYLPEDRRDLGGRLDDFVSALILIVNMILLTSWLFWQRPKTDAERKRDQERPGLLARIYRAVRKLLGLSGDSDTESVELENWVDPLLAMGPDEWGRRFQCASIKESQRQVTTAAHGLSSVDRMDSSPGDMEYGQFFGDDVTPQAGQHDVVSKLVAAAHLNLEQRENPYAESSGDMLIRGEAGTGRTTSLAAASLALVINRRHQVLVLCADPASANAFKRMLDDTNDVDGLGALRKISRLTQGLMDFIESGKRYEVAEILIATPREVNRFFFEDKEEGDAKVFRKAMIQEIDSILVDDIMDMRPSDRLHLPFLLGKLRLINEVEGKRVQMAVVIPDIQDKSVRNRVGARLFSATYQWDECHLRPWHDAPEVELDVVVDDMDMAYQKLAAHLLEKGQSVVVVRDIAALEQLRERILKDLPSSAAGRLHVVSSIKHLGSTGLASTGATASEAAEPTHRTEWCVIMKDVGQDAGGRGPIPALRSGKRVAVLHMRTTLEQPPPKSSDKIIRLPVLASSNSQGLLVRELTSVVGYLSIGAARHRNIWRHFGIPKIRGLHKPGKGEVVRDDFILRVDPAEATAGLKGQRRMPGNTQGFPWVQLDRRSGRSRAIGPVEYQEGISYLRLINDTELVATDLELGDQTTGSDQLLYSNRIAHWEADGETQSERLDLARAAEISMHGPRGKLVASGATKDPATGQVRFLAAVSLGTEREFLYPVWSGGFSILSSDKVKPLSSNQHLPGSVRLYNLCREENEQLPHLMDVRWALNGTFSRSGRRDPIEAIQFKYKAVASVLLFGDVNTNTLDWCCGEWSADMGCSDRCFWPELTAALMAALNYCAPDSGRLGRIMAFKASANEVGAHVFILESLEMAGTLVEVLRDILMGETFFDQFISRARRVLDDVPREQPFGSLAVPARQAYSSFESVLDLPAAKQLLSTLAVESSSGQGVPLE